MVVGRASLADAPLQGFAYASARRPPSRRSVSPPPGVPARDRPSQGSPASRSSSPDVVAAHWFTAPSSPFSRPRGLPPSGRPGRKRPSGSHGLGRPLRARASPPTRGLAASGSPRGVWRPFSDIRNKVRSTRACLTRHVPSAEFLTPSTVCSLATLRSRGPLPLVGFLVRSGWSARFAACYQTASTSHSLRPGPML